jgi:ketosteroid isomerase-like protein
MTEPTTAPAPVERFIGAVNAHDEQRFLDAFTDDGVVNDWGREFAGRKAIKAWSDDEFIGANGTMAVTGIEERDGEIRVTADWRSTHANGLSLFAFTVRGDKIAQMRITAG